MIAVKNPISTGSILKDCTNNQVFTNILKDLNKEKEDFEKDIDTELSKMIKNSELFKTDD